MSDRVEKSGLHVDTALAAFVESEVLAPLGKDAAAFWQGFAALGTFNLFVARIAIASFMAYALGQILDVHVFNRLRQNRRWWLAPTASTLFGNVSDTLAFFFIAFWRSPDPFMAAHWGEIAIVDYCFKVLISIVFFLPMYGMLLNMLLKKLADKSDLSALQPG